jgi:hypothetical protein
MSEAWPNRTELVDAICARMEQGEALEVICREPGMPASRTVRDWREQDPEIAKKFDAARDAGYDAIARRARMTARGKGEEEGGDSTNDVQRDKLIIDTDLKLLSKWDPRRYGDKIEHSGPGGEPLPAPVFNIFPTAPRE